MGRRSQKGSKKHSRLERRKIGGGFFLGVHAARAFAEDGKEWKKMTPIVPDMLIAGGTMAGLGV
jgi:hypothetical protein